MRDGEGVDGGVAFGPALGYVGEGVVGVAGLHGGCGGVVEVAVVFAAGAEVGCCFVVAGVGGYDRRGVVVEGIVQSSRGGFSPLIVGHVAKFRVRGEACTGFIRGVGFAVVVEEVCVVERGYEGVFAHRFPGFGDVEGGEVAGQGVGEDSVNVGADHDVGFDDVGPHWEAAGVVIDSEQGAHHAVDSLGGEES